MLTRPAVAITLTVAALCLTGCRTFQQIAALEQVEFSIHSLSDIDLAGVRLDRVRSYEDLAPADVVRLLAAVAEGRLPLFLRVNVEAENPAENLVTARLLRLDWTLFLEDRETVSGALVEEVAIPSGETIVFPIEAGVDLLRFFSESGPDLLDLVLGLMGQGTGQPKEIVVRATPTIETAIGPITYPGAITIVRESVGGATIPRSREMP